MPSLVTGGTVSVEPKLLVPDIKHDLLVHFSEGKSVVLASRDHIYYLSVSESSQLQHNTNSVWFLDIECDDPRIKSKRTHVQRHVRVQDLCMIDGISVRIATLRVFD